MQDIHTHLYWESFDIDRGTVLKRAKDAGITAMLVVGTTVEESSLALELAERHAELFATVGIHPNEFRGNEKYIKSTKIPVLLKKLEELVAARKEQVVAVGECGLDYSESHGVITEADKLYQVEIFEGQIRLAQKYNLPLIVHCRAASAQRDDAYWDLLAVLRARAPELSHIVLHCYMGSVAVTKEFLAIPNIYFSFTGNITYPVKQDMKGGSYDLTRVVETVPLEKIFVETDCPFLAPQKYRGKRNEPAFVKEVAKKVADIHRVAVETIEQSTGENFTRVFKIPKNSLD